LEGFWHDLNHGLRVRNWGHYHVKKADYRVKKGFQSAAAHPQRNYLRTHYPPAHSQALTPTRYSRGGEPDNEEPNAAPRCLGPFQLQKQQKTPSRQEAGGIVALCQGLGEPIGSNHLGLGEKKESVAIKARTTPGRKFSKEKDNYSRPGNRCINGPPTPNEKTPTPCSSRKKEGQKAVPPCRNLCTRNKRQERVARTGNCSSRQNPDMQTSKWF